MHAFRQQIAPPASSSDMSAQTRALLNRLRVCGAACRAAPHLDMQEAWSGNAKPGGQNEAAQTLIRALRAATGRDPIWYRLGEASISFDESWLLRVIDRHRAKDHDSVAFLVRRRISRDRQRHFVALVDSFIAHNF